MHEIYLEHSHGYFGPMKEVVSSGQKYCQPSPMHPRSAELDNGSIKVGDYAIQFRPNKDARRDGKTLNSSGFRLGSSYGDNLR